MTAGARSGGRALSEGYSSRVAECTRLILV
jgi:hypothetical protein